VVKVVGSDAGKFVSAHAERVERDLNRMYQDFYPGTRLSSDVVRAVLADLEARLSRALGEHLLPKVTYAPVQFVAGGGSEWESPWGQALVLLRSIAEYPRKALTDGYFLRGLRVDQAELLVAMDVCQDKGTGTENAPMAKEELALVERIMDSLAPARDKCQALLNLMAGTPLAHIEAALARAAKASSKTAEATGLAPTL
jgi:hypothetical protein